MKIILKRWFILLLLFILVILPIASLIIVPLGVAFSQTIPVAAYVYYGQLINSEDMREISAQRYNQNGETTTCVHVPSETYILPKIEFVQTYHCFDTEEEAWEFALQMNSIYEP